jgi:hypothetical protein
MKGTQVMLMLSLLTSAVLRNDWVNAAVEERSFLGFGHMTPPPLLA